MCAITGVYSPDGQAALHARALLHFQQNRGQDTSGICTVQNGQVYWRKGEGKVLEVFGKLILPPEMVRGNSSSIDQLKGNYAVGHNRYMTIGVGGADNAQPFYTENERFVVAMSHNGHVNNYEAVSQKLNLEERMKRDAAFGKPSDCDVVPILFTFADGLLKKENTIDGILQGAEDVMRTVRGAYTVTATVHDKSTGKTYQIAFKDPMAIRPGFFGNSNGSYAICSETFPLERTGFWNVKPPKNAEVLIIDEREIIRQQIAAFKAYEHMPCQFELAYFSRALSVLDGRSVNHVRFMLGLALARKIMKEHPEWVDIIDFTTYVPNTPMPIAKGVERGLETSFRDCIEKDPFDYGREFINKSGQRHVKTRERSAVHWDAVTGRSFILVDDSLVRGDTMKTNIAMLRRAGAANIFVASAYPRIEYRCDLGIDMKTREELIAPGKTDAQIAETIGADGIIFLTQTEYERALNDVDLDAGLRKKIEVGIFSPEILEFVSKGKRCNACVTGKNPTHE